MIVPSIRTHTDAIKEALEAEGLTVGDAEGGGSPPYVVIYSIPGGEASGSLEEPNEDGEMIYQVSCVGVTREQAEWLADKSMVLLDGFSVAGRSIALVSIDSFPGTRRDDTISPPYFLSTPRFRIKTTPA